MDRRLWRPLPGPQSQAYQSEADELFYGGAAGGGKTDLLLGLALTQHRRSILFRREYPQLKAIIDRGNELVGNAGKFNVQGNTWRLTDGRMVELGAVQYEHDVRKYQGRPHDLKLFDELTNFTEYQYRFLSGWLRTTQRGQRTRIVSTGNPPSSTDGEWVIRRWAAWLDRQHPQPARPGELRWYAVIDGEDREQENGRAFRWQGETIQPKSRTFIPARLADNPFLAATGYAAQVQALPEPLRTQLLYGDFSVGLDDNPWQTIPTEWVRMAQARWREMAQPASQLTAVGVDVARGGKDKTVIAKRYGWWFAPLLKHPGASTPDGGAVAGLVLQALDPGSDPAVHVDVIGVGASVYDALKANPLRLWGVNVAEGSDATDRSGRLTFVNLRAEGYWLLREALDPATGDDLALPDDSELLSDLCAPRWKLGPRGIQIESKEDVTQRLGRSPDCGDAVVLAALRTRQVQYAQDIWG